MNNLDESYLECSLPKHLLKCIKKMQEAWKKIDNNEEYSLWDCDYCELNSEINVCEVEHLISSKQANYIRKKYLRMNEEDYIN